MNLKTIILLISIIFMISSVSAWGISFNSTDVHAGTPVLVAYDNPGTVRIVGTDTTTGTMGQIVYYNQTLYGTGSFVWTVPSNPRMYFTMYSLYFGYNAQNPDLLNLDNSSSVPSITSYIISPPYNQTPAYMLMCATATEYPYKVNIGYSPTSWDNWSVNKEPIVFNPLESTNTTSVHHWYNTTGIYNTTIEMCNKNGCAHTMIDFYAGIIPDLSVDFTGTPRTGTAPLHVSFVASNITNSTGVSWSFGEGQTYIGNLSTATYDYVNPGIYTVSMEYSNSSGFRNTVTKLNYITVSPQGNISLLVDILDAITGDLIQNSQVGIQNTTSGVWRNSTAAGGTPIFQSTGANYEYPLRIGQMVVVAGGAFGYDNQSANITIPYNNYEHALHLMPLNKAATNGSWNVVVLIKSNKYGTPINSATVQVTTGVNGQGMYQSLTGKDGLATFTNVSASTTAMIRAVAQGYQDTSVVIPVFVNTTQHVTIEMVGLDDTPVATPIPTSNKTPMTGQPTPQITDENGNPITTSEGKAQWGLDQLFNLIPTIALIVASLIIAWLFWRGIDICTNGMATLIMRKVIEGFIRQMFK